jgi:hypothetical protein
MGTTASPVRGLLLAISLAVILIFVLPIIVLKALRAASPQAPEAVVNAAAVNDQPRRQEAAQA